MDEALSLGASAARVTLNKSVTDLVGLLGGEVDKVTRSLDRSIQLILFVDGRFGSFSSNRLDPGHIHAFVRRAVDTVRMLEKDPLRSLPDPARQTHQARSGREMDLYDPAWESMEAPERRSIALSSSWWGRKAELEKGFTVISEEGEYSDSCFDSLVMDTGGLYARHTETSFEIGYEVTVEDPEGNRFASYWWDGSPRLADLLPAVKDCARTALLRAAAQIGPRSVPSGKYSLIVDRDCASRMVTPLLKALGGFSIQQKNSFLLGSPGKKVFSENLTVVDRPHEKGATGSCLFDSEGVATQEREIISRGVVNQYFLNTYYARKLEMEPTAEDCTRVKVMPTGGCTTCGDVLRKVGDGILVTGFNGGNSNSSSGDFSYGVEGFLVRNGEIVHPVREMLVTGNFITLWGNLVAAADDARPCTSRLIPTLAFGNVDFSA